VVVRRKLDWINKQHLHRLLADTTTRPRLAADAMAALAPAMTTNPQVLPLGPNGVPRWRDAAYVLAVLDAVKVRPAPPHQRTGHRRTNPPP
jgi:hypothetical protein